MKTIHDCYLEDEVTGPENGYSFEEWLVSVAEGVYPLACCKTGVLFEITEEQASQVKPGDPCVCYEYLAVLDECKEEVELYGVDAIVGLKLSLDSRPFNLGRSIYHPDAQKVFQSTDHAEKDSSM